MKLPTATGEYVITDDLKAGLVVRYPYADVDRELALMHLWLTRHEKRRPKRIFVFIDRWFAKIKLNGVGAEKRRVTGDTLASQVLLATPPLNNVTPIRQQAVTVRQDLPRPIGDIVKGLRFVLEDKK